MIADVAPNTVQAKFNPLIRPYLVVYVAFFLSMTIVGLPLALIWILGVGQWWAGHYFEKLHCEITDNEVNFRKGILFEVAKTIPLENIQDVTFIEGPLLRKFQLSTLRFETAGQGSGPRSNAMELIGIIDAHAFRQQILQRRTALRNRGHSPATAVVGAGDEQVVLLRGINARLEEIAGLLRDKRLD